MISKPVIRNVSQDYASMFKDNEKLDDEDLALLDRDLADETGWKKVHGDVFRSPSNIKMLCVLMGVGYQLIFLLLCVVGVPFIFEGSGASVTF